MGMATALCPSSIQRFMGRFAAVLWALCLPAFSFLDRHHQMKAAKAMPFLL